MAALHCMLACYFVTPSIIQDRLNMVAQQKRISENNFRKRTRASAVSREARRQSFERLPSGTRHDRILYGPR